MDRHRILVADDDADTADTLARLLDLHGYEVRTVYDGQQAINAAEHFHPHLVILDIRMPVLNGFEAARVLNHTKTGGKKLLLVALTGLPDGATRDEAHAAGFDVVIPKAVDSEYLCDLVQGLIDTNERDAHAGDPLDRVLVAAKLLS